jgi:hypothetical protein
MRIVSGVGLLLFDSDGRILLLEELESKLHYCKVAGMLSIPIETIKERETCNLAIERLIVEEVGVPIAEAPSFFKEFMIKLNDRFTERLFVFMGVCEKSFVARPNDTDIAYYGWFLPQNILDFPPGKVRVEVEPVLRSYLGQ